MILASPRAVDQTQVPALRVLAGGLADQQPVTLDRFIGWYGRHFDLVGEFGRVDDGRSPAHVKVPLPTVLLAAVAMFWVGMKSVHELEDRLRHNAGLRALLGRLTDYGKAFCEDTVRDVVSVLGPGQLRGLVHAQVKRGTQQWGARYWGDCELAARLRPIHASSLAAKLVIAIDGHELFCSSTRCCSDCRVRNKKVKRGGKTILTDLPVGSASAVAAVLLYEERWSIESAFHELAGRWSFDHAFVHKGRPTAVLAFVALAILAFNAMQMYVYRHLQRQPGAHRRPLSAYRATMILCSRGKNREAYAVAMAHDP